MGRSRRGEGEHFAYLPESVLTSVAVTTMPHAALRVLAALVAGQTKERNGLQMCSNSYAARFGITSTTTLHASLALLQERGLIIRTWSPGRLARTPARYGVTWWPILYRENQPVAQVMPATYAYLKYQPLDPVAGLKKRERNGKGRFSLVQPLDNNSPPNGLNTQADQSSGWRKNGFDQSTGWTHSTSRPGVGGLGQQLADVRMSDLVALARSNPEIGPAELAKRCKASEADAHRALQRLQAEATP